MCRSRWLGALLGCVTTFLGCGQNGADVGELAAERAEIAATTKHSRCGWIDSTAGVASFQANPSYFDVVHPMWYKLGSDSKSVVANPTAEDPDVIDTARAYGVQVWPVVAGSEDVTYVRTMLNSSTLRSAHIDNLVNLAVTNGYPGLDLDYEHLWNSSDRAPWNTFVQQLASAMHDAGKKLSLATPSLAAANGAWDYHTLSSYVDILHVMGYDYHHWGSTHAGPLAPLGWIKAMADYAVSTGRVGKFILGLNNYGFGMGYACSGTDCADECGWSWWTSTGEMTTCPMNVDTGYTAGRVANCETSHGRIFFDDVPALEEKVQVAKDHGFGGIVYWTVGKEHAGFFEMVFKYYGNGYAVSRLTDEPARDVVTRISDGAWMATLTYGARAARLRAPTTRTISDGALSFTSDQRVRIMATPYDGVIPWVWLEAKFADSSTDIIDRAAQYFPGETRVSSAIDGKPLYGDACFECSASSPSPGADFYDYRGMTYWSGVAPQARFLWSLDAAGYVRMLYGYRGSSGDDKIAMSAPGVLESDKLPRTAGNMYSYASAPGKRFTISSGNGNLYPGDLVFYGSSSTADHVGIVVYKNGSTIHVVSSRAGMQGPDLHALTAISGLKAKALRL